MKKLFILVFLILFAVVYLACARYNMGEFPLYPTRLECTIVQPGAEGLGPSAPSFTKVASSGGLLFAKAAAGTEEAFIGFVYSDPCVVSGTDAYLSFSWSSEDGDAVADGETIKFNYHYRTLVEGDSLDTGTEATATGTYTQSGAGANLEVNNTLLTIPYSGGNQPLQAHDGVTGHFQYDPTSTYSGNVHMGGTYICRTVNSVCAFYF